MRAQPPLRLLRGRHGPLSLLAVILIVPACVVAVAARSGPGRLADVAETAATDAAAGVTGTAAAAAVPAAALDLPTGFEPYLYRPSGERADPVNVIFLHTDAATAAVAVERVLGWRPVVASGMNFRHKSGVRPTSRQLAADLGPASRYHMRIQAVPITDTQTYVLASVHRDETVSCGHVGRAFDEMRDLVARKFAEAGFQVRFVELGNTNSGLHCDGSRVNGDGIAVLIDLSRVPRVDRPSRNRVPGVY